MTYTVEIDQGNKQSRMNQEQPRMRRVNELRELHLTEELNQVRDEYILDTIDQVVSSIGR